MLFKFIQSDSIVKVHAQQSIDKRNAVIDEYIKSLDDNKETTHNEITSDNNNIQDDFEDPFLFPVNNIEKQQHVYDRKPLSQNKPSRYSKNTNLQLQQPLKNTNQFYKTNNTFTKQANTLMHFNNNSNNTFLTNNNNYINFLNNNRNNYIQLYSTYKKKRNNTAKNQPTKFNCVFKKINNNNTLCSIPRIKSTNNGKPHNNTFKAIHSIHNHYTQMMNDPKNPYSTNWTNKYLDKNYKMELGMNGFLNGVPVITLNKKKDKYETISKKELKERLNKMSKQTKGDEELSEEEVPKEMAELFNTNRKNFYQVRKDIVEESQENEDKSDGDDDKEIEFPVIWKYFDKGKGYKKEK